MSDTSYEVWPKEDDVFCHTVMTKTKKAKNKDRMPFRPNICLESKYHNLSSQSVIFLLVNQTRTDQNRDDFNLAELILETFVVLAL